MNRLINYTFIITLILFGTACRSKKISTEPDYDTNIKTYEPVLSTFNLPIEIPLNLIEKTINQEFKNTIYEDNSYEDNNADNLKLKVWKNRDITLKGYKEYFTTKIPLKIWAQYQLKPCEVCPKIEKQTSADIVLNFTTKISVTNKWILQTQTIANDYTWETKPMISFGIVDINVAPFVDPILKNQLKEIAKLIDTEINKNFNLKNYVEEAWKNIQNPILVNEENKLWLQFKPVEFVMTNINSDNNIIRLGIGLKSYINTAIGNKPIIDKYLPLADLKQVDKINEDFNLTIENFIDFETATQLAQKHLKDTIFEAKGKKVKIDDIQVFGKGSKVYVKTDVSQSIKGSIYFFGIPSYDANAMKIYLKDFDFDIKTKNKLLKTAEWLLHGTLKKRMEKEFTYTLEKDIKTAKADLQAMLKNYNYANIFNIKGNITDIALQDVYVTQTGIKTVLNAKGNMLLRITGISF